VRSSTVTARAAPDAALNLNAIEPVSFTLTSAKVGLRPDTASWRAENEAMRAEDYVGCRLISGRLEQNWRWIREIILVAFSLSFMVEKVSLFL
jgi:hypothetical protein